MGPLHGLLPPSRLWTIPHTLQHLMPRQIHQTCFMLLAYNFFSPTDLLPS